MSGSPVVAPRRVDPAMIALVGQSVVDRVTLPGRPRVERLGGAPIFAAQAIVAAGARAVVFTRGAAPALRRPLHGLGLRVIEGPSTHSCISEMVLHPDGSCADAFAAFGDPFTPADVAGWMASGLAGARVVVCGAQWRDDFPAETLEALAAGGRRVYLDGQGPLRVRRLGPVRLEGALTPALMRHVDVLKLAEEEAAVALGNLDAGAARGLGVPVVVITRGHRGAVVVADGIVTEVGVEPVLGLADTVGAGDAFLALMALEEAQGAAVVEAVRRACSGVAAMLRRRLASETPAAPGSGHARQACAMRPLVRTVAGGGAPEADHLSLIDAAPAHLPVAGVERLETGRPDPGGAVLFDFGGTLDADGVTWKERIRRLFESEGAAPPPSEFDPVFYAADDALTGRIPATLSFAETVVRLVAGVGAGLGVRDPGVTERVASRFLADSLAQLRARTPLLRRLAGRYRLGLVSNYYGNLATACVEAGIRPFFAVVVDSARVGYCKPDPRIFQHALRALDVAPGDAVFVGDSLSRDMGGARGVGMPHIWLAPEASREGGPCCPGDRVVPALGAVEGLLL